MAGDQLYIFGLQRTGTNYLTKLVRENLGYNLKNKPRESWKHQMKPPIGEHLSLDCPRILVHKNPYLWIESISGRNKVDYLRTQLDFPPTEQLDVPTELLLGEHKINVQQMARAWSSWMNNWIINTPKYLNDNKTIIISYDNLLIEDSRNTFLDQLQSIEGRERTPHARSAWINPAPGTVPQSKDLTKDRLQSYINIELQFLQKDHLDLINQVLDSKAMEYGRYDFINR